MYSLVYLCVLQLSHWSPPSQLCISGWFSFLFSYWSWSDVQDQLEQPRDQPEYTRNQPEDTRDQPEEILCFLPTEILMIIIDNVLNIDLSYGLSLSLVSRSFARMVQLHMKWVYPTRMIFCQAESIHIRYSLQMELGIHGQHHYMLSVRRLMTTAGKFSGLPTLCESYCSQ